MRIMQDKEIFKNILAYGLCIGYGCEEGTPGMADHSCPFAEDIHGDQTTLCNCCEDCATQCAHEI